MNRWVVLLRGINVGGKNIVPMKKLTEMLENMGCEAVRTYIQSGNILLQHAESDSRVLAKHIASQMYQCFSFEPEILLLTFSQFAQAAAANPFSAAESEPKTLHLFFLSEPLDVLDKNKLQALKAPTETYNLIEQVFYLHAPAGIGRSKLAARVEKTLGVPTTARNWNTVSKLLALAV